MLLLFSHLYLLFRRQNILIHLVYNHISAPHFSLYSHKLLFFFRFNATWEYPGKWNFFFKKILSNFQFYSFQLVTQLDKPPGVSRSYLNKIQWAENRNLSHLYLLCWTKTTNKASKLQTLSLISVFKDTAENILYCVATETGRYLLMAMEVILFGLPRRNFSIRSFSTKIACEFQLTRFLGCLG